MKRIFLLCAALGVAVIIGGCANQVTPATDTAQARANREVAWWTPARSRGYLPALRDVWVASVPFPRR